MDEKTEKRIKEIEKRISRIEEFLFEPNEDGKNFEIRLMFIEGDFRDLKTRMDFFEQQRKETEEDLNTLKKIILQIIPNPITDFIQHEGIDFILFGALGGVDARKNKTKKKLKSKKWVL